MEGDLPWRPGITDAQVQLLIGEGTQADIEDLGEAGQPAACLGQIFSRECGQVCGCRGR